MILTGLGQLFFPKALPWSQWRLTWLGLYLCYRGLIYLV